MNMLRAIIAAVRKLKADNPDDGPHMFLCACGYPNVPCKKRYRHICFAKLEQEAKDACKLADVRRKLGWINGVPPAGTSHYMAKCKRLRDDGPTPCLCCQGECYGVR